MIHAVHAPFTKSADMWRENEEKAEIAVAELLEVLSDCAKYGAPIMVCHPWIGFNYSDVPGEPGFSRYARVIERAKELNIKVAIENTEGEEFLFALMERFKNDDTVGFCWDSGHEACYNHSKDLLGMYGDRLLVTHLNDNLGISRFDGVTFWTDDLHLLPYDGIIDWDHCISKLKACPPLEIINFELNKGSKPSRHDNDIYTAMSAEVYLAEAYKRACKIAFRYQG